MIKPPSWKKDAVPTPKGWRHPKTGELLLPKKLSEADIAEYMGAPAPVTLTNTYYCRRTCRRTCRTN